MRHRLVLPALALLAVPPQDTVEIALRPRAAGEVTWTVERRSELELVELLWRRDGGAETDVLDGYSIELVLTSTRLRVLEDEWLASDARGLSDVRRRFASVAGRLGHVSALGGYDPENDGVTLGSALEGVTARVRRAGEGDPQWEIEDGDGDGELLADLVLLPPLADLLPDEPVAQGARWFPDAAVGVGLVLPFEPLPERLESDDDQMGDLLALLAWLLSPEQLFPGADGRVVARLTEIDEDADVARLSLTVELYPEGERDEAALAGAGELEIDEGWHDYLRGVQVEGALDAEVDMLWDLNGDRPREWSLEGELDVTLTVELDVGGSAWGIVAGFRGTQRASVRLE